MSEDAEFQEWLKTRNEALTNLDMNWARELLMGQGHRALSDEVLLIALHKARYHCKGVADTLRHESRKWLADRNYKQGLLPEGTLPE